MSSTTQSNVWVDSQVGFQKVEITLYNVPSQAIKLTADGNRVDSLDLAQFFTENGFDWSAPSTLTFSGSDQGRSGDDIRIRFEPGTQYLVRSLSRLPKDLDNSQSSIIDLDGDLDALLASANVTSRVEYLVRSTKGGGFKIDHMRVSLASEGSSTIKISGSRQRKKVKAALAIEGTEYV